LDLSGGVKLEVTSDGFHADGRAVTIPIHGGRAIGPPLFHRILQQLGISAEEFRKLK
jgi:hypothetical protein